MKVNLREQNTVMPRVHKLQSSFAPKHQYCTQATNSCARVAIHKLQFIQANNSRTPGSNSVTQVKRIFLCDT